MIEEKGVIEVERVALAPSPEDQILTVDACDE